MGGLLTGGTCKVQHRRLSEVGCRGILNSELLPETVRAHKHNIFLFFFFTPEHVSEAFLFPAKQSLSWRPGLACPVHTTKSVRRNRRFRADGPLIQEVNVNAPHGRTGEQPICRLNLPPGFICGTRVSRPRQRSCTTQAVTLEKKRGNGFV